MANSVGSILNVKNTTLDITETDTIYLSVSKRYEHVITIENANISSLYVSSTAYLTNSNTGQKYTLSTTRLTSTTFKVITEPRTTEFADIDELELVVIHEDVEYRAKIYITPIYVNSYTNVIEFKTGSVLLNQSNMLYPRIKLGFPKWGTIEKNSISNGTKLLEPLFTPLYDSYFKVISFNLHTKYKVPYQKFRSFETGYRPDSVFQYSGTLYKKLHECSSVQSLPRRVTLDSSPTSLTASRLFLLNSTDYDYDFSFLSNTRIYCRKLNNALTQDVLTIKGLDLKGDRLEERVIVVEDFYTCAVHKFSKIFTITCSSNVIVANYVNCMFNHFIVKDINTFPPIVDSDLFAFFPQCVKFSNNEKTRDTLHIFNNTNYLTEPQYKFDLEHTGRITSMYIDEFLRLYWTDSSNKLYTNCINHDLSKDVGKNPSNNNNNVIIVSDQNTAIGDWVDVSVMLNEWEANTSMVLQVKNGTETLYYDQETESFVSGIRYFYPPENLDILEVSAKVLNDSPYIFTVFDDTLEKQYTASTQSQYLKSIQEPLTVTGTLSVINDKLSLTDNKVNTTSYMALSDKILLTLTSKDLSMLDWELDFLGMRISKTFTSMPEHYYSIVSNGNGDNPLIIEIDRMSVINDYNLDRIPMTLNFKFDTMYNRSVLSSVELQLADKYGVRDKDLSVTASDEYLSIPMDFTRNTKDINYVAI